MSLEAKSSELKALISGYNTQWFLGYLSGLMRNIVNGSANEELGNLSSPLRQLYYLGGLLLTSESASGTQSNMEPENWDEIVSLLNDIEVEYSNLFFPETDEEIDDKWIKVRSVAMPSFLSYFNQGPLNYEEQTINWVRDLYGKLDSIIEPKIGVKTEELIEFYENIDKLNQSNFKSFMSKDTPLRKDWEKYTNLSVELSEGVPEEFKALHEERKPMMTFLADPGIIDRFQPEELVSETLPIEKVQTILNLLKSQREVKDFLYYTETKPGNPLYDFPVIEIGNNMFQIFEVKQVIHSIERLLQKTCSTNSKETSKLTELKGKLLESNIKELFKKLFKTDFEIYQGYYIDGCEQDILILWKNYAFIIEAKGYNLREPMRDPDKAFNRIKDDFKNSIGYGYEQTQRVEKKFKDQVPLKIEDKDGNLIKEIDTKKYHNNDFSIIVTQNSFGQIQNDLSTLLEIAEDDVFPWAVRFDDLETFILHLIANKKMPKTFIDYLLMREDLHGKLLCSDESEVCGGYLSGRINNRVIEKSEIIATTPELANVFDVQYNKGMGFKNEKYLSEKKSGKTIFL